MSLKYALLGQLARGPQTGYGLAKSFAGSLNYAWPASRSQIYPELARLRESGLIRQTASGPRSSKVYETTPKGLNELRHWLRETEPDRIGRNEPLLRLFLLWLLERDEATAYLRRERELLELELEELEGIAEEDDPQTPPEQAAALALEHGLRILRTRIGWVDWALAEVVAWPDSPQNSVRPGS
jgi:PadR family transcriptional regulator, regulatory protein AphA